MDPLLFLQNDTVIGVLIAGAGGVFVRWLDKTLREKTSFHSQLTDLRNELRTELQSCHSRVSELEEDRDKLEVEVDMWKDKYYTIREIQLMKESVEKLADQDNILPLD